MYAPNHTINTYSEYTRISMKYNLNNVIATRLDKVVYRDKNMVIKVFSNSYSKASVLNEALNQARVEETGLNIPKILEITVLNDGEWAIISEFIEGKTIETLMHENPEKTDEYLEKLVDLQIEISSRKCPLLSKLRDKMQQKISATSLDAANRYELHTRLEGMPNHNKLCHGDFNPSNVIVTPKGSSYIIDWSHATQGNSSADVARTCLYFKLRGEAFLAEKYITLFCNKSNTPRQYVEKWMPIVAASQSIKGNPNERNALLEMVNIIDHE